MPRARDIARGLRKHMTETMESTVVMLARNVTISLRDANPKDTTWSSLNWIPSRRRPAKRGGPGFDAAHKSREAKLALVPYEQAAQSGSLKELANFKLRDGYIYITNFVEYLEHLIEGSSPQAPRGWERMAIEEGIAKTVVVLTARP